MSQSSLESSIKEESARLVSSIREKEAAQLRRLEESFMAEIDSFTRQVAGETDVRLQRELAKIENWAELERKKSRLAAVDALINLARDEIGKSLRLEPGYKTFILNAVRDAVECCASAQLQVRLMAQDLALAPQIREIVNTAGASRDLLIEEDATIKLGGCLVLDVPTGRIFNSTLERLYFRKIPLIRREVVKILRDHARSVTSGTSPRVGQ